MRPVLPGQEYGRKRVLLPGEVCEQVGGQLGEGLDQPGPSVGGVGVVQVVCGCFDLVEEVGDDPVIGFEPVDDAAEVRCAA